MPVMPEDYWNPMPTPWPGGQSWAEPGPLPGNGGGPLPTPGPIYTGGNDYPGAGPTVNPHYPAPGEGAPRQPWHFNPLILTPAGALGSVLRRIIHESLERHRTRESMQGGSHRAPAYYGAGFQNVPNETMLGGNWLGTNPDTGNPYYNPRGYGALADLVAAPPPVGQHFDYVSGHMVPNNANGPGSLSSNPNQGGAYYGAGSDMNYSAMRIAM